MSISSAESDSVSVELAKNNSNSDDLDLISILEFFWFWKKTLLAASGAGLVLALLYSGIMLRRERLLANRETQVRVSPAFDFGQSSTLDFFGMSKFLKTPAGSAQISKEMQRSLSKYIAARSGAENMGDGSVLLSLNVTESNILLSLRTPKTLNAEDLKNISRDGLLSTAISLNKVHDSAQLTAVESLMRMNAIRIRAFGLFQKYYAFQKSESVPLNGIVALEVTRNYSPEFIAFLLAPVPESNEEKSELISSYRISKKSYDKAHAIITSVDGFTASGAFAEEKQELNQPDIFVDQPRSSVSKKPAIMGVLGLVGGLFVGIFVTSFFGFWSDNKHRLKKLNA